MKRRAAWILLLIVNAGIVAWGAMAALLPDYLLGPGGQPILPAGFEGYTGSSWTELARSSPMTAGFIEILFRMYGAFNAIVGLLGMAIAATAFRRGDTWAWWTLLVSNTMALVLPMTYDRTVHAIGPFEVSEYLGLGLVVLALATTMRTHTAHRPMSAAG